MLSTKALDGYLDRQFNDFDWLKECEPEYLDYLISEIKPRPILPDKANNSQKAAVILGAAYPHFLFQLDMGLGKTLLGLTLLHWLYNKGDITKAFVVVPTDEIAQGWEDEINKWQVDIPYLVLLGSNEQKWTMLKAFDKGLVICTYIGFATMVSKLQIKTKGTNGAKDKKGYVIDPKLVDLALTDLGAVLFDETTKAGVSGKSNALTYLACKHLSHRAKYRYGLAGRLFGRDPAPIYGQYYLIDHGDTFGKTLGLFREAFFKKQLNIWSGFYDFVFDKKKEPELARLIKNKSIRYKITDCADLPPVVRINKSVSFPGSTEVYYQKCVQEIIDASKRKDGNRFREIKGNFIRMRQISSGFLGMVDDETGEKATIEFDINPKLDLLMQLIDEMPNDRKALIFHEFTWSGGRICQELKKAKIKHGWLWSGTKNWKAIKEKFDNDPDFKVLVINNHKGIYGLNLQAANYGFFFESPVSPIDREQAERRILRQGQEHRVLIYDLCVRGSVDYRILDFHQEGNDLFSALVEYPQKLLDV